MRRFVLTAVVAVLLSALAGTATAAAKGSSGNGFPPSVKRFNLNGYVLQTSYSLGRNKGNTFKQTYKRSTVQGVPVKGPAVGMTFPPVDYVALNVAPQTLYVAWLDPSTHAIVDAFVMNFKTGVVFDYAPGSSKPESSGTVKVLKKGRAKIK
jgi:hypothetical protein